MEGEEGKKEENSLVSIPSAYLFFSARIMVRNPEFPHAMLVRVHCIRSESLWAKMRMTKRFTSAAPAAAESVYRNWVAAAICLFGRAELTAHYWLAQHHEQAERRPLLKWVFRYGGFNGYKKKRGYDGHGSGRRRGAARQTLTDWTWIFSFLGRLIRLAAAGSIEERIVVAAVSWLWDDRPTDRDPALIGSASALLALREQNCVPHPRHTIFSCLLSIIIHSWPRGRLVAQLSLSLIFLVPLAIVLVSSKLGSITKRFHTPETPALKQQEGCVQFNGKSQK